MNKNISLRGHIKKDIAPSSTAFHERLAIYILVGIKHLEHCHQLVYLYIPFIFLAAFVSTPPIVARNSSPIDFVLQRISTYRNNLLRNTYKSTTKDLNGYTIINMCVCGLASILQRVRSIGILGKFGDKNAKAFAFVSQHLIYMAPILTNIYNQRRNSSRWMFFILYENTLYTLNASSSVRSSPM